MPQVMACSLTAPSDNLSQCWLRYMSPCVTKPQRVKWLPLCAAFKSGNFKIYFISYFSLTLKRCRLLSFTFKGNKKIPISVSQYYGCWWPSNERRQGTSIHGIDLALLEYFGHMTRKNHFRRIMLTVVNWFISFTGIYYPAAETYNTQELPCPRSPGPHMFKVYSW